MNQQHFPRFAWGVFAYSLLVIAWGYYLRVSESGDGCGTDWPLCRGVVVPDAAELSTLVELTHRVSSGLVLVLVAAMAVWAFRAFPRGHAVRAGAGLALLFTVTESLFGAVLVVFGWVAGDVSTARIVIRPFHVTNTFCLMAALALTPFWATRAVGTNAAMRTPRLGELRTRPGPRLVAPALLGVLALGWTGSWTGLATTAFPTGTLAEGLGQYLAPEHLLIYLRMLHPLLAVAVVVVVVRTALGLRARYDDPTVRGLALGVGALAAVQLVVGPLTVLLLSPVWSRLLHLLLADVLWIGLIVAGAAALVEDAGGFSSIPEEGSLALDPAHEPGQ